MILPHLDQKKLPLFHGHPGLTAGQHFIADAVLVRAADFASRRGYFAPSTVIPSAVPEIFSREKNRKESSMQTGAFDTISISE